MWTPGLQRPLVYEFYETEFSGAHKPFNGVTMTRRTMLWTPLVVGAKRAWNALASGLGGPWGTAQAEASPPSTGDAGTRLQTSNHSLAFDEKSGRVVSLCSALAPEQEFVVSNEKMPVF